MYNNFLHDIEVAVNELSPRSTQSISRATMSPMINALTNATVAAVIASVEEDTEVPVPRRTTRSQSARLNLAATCTFEGFVPANNPNTHVKEGSAWIYRLKGLL